MTLWTAKTWVHLEIVTMIRIIGFWDFDYNRQLP